MVSTINLWNAEATMDREAAAQDFQSRRNAAQGAGILGEFAGFVDDFAPATAAVDTDKGCANIWVGFGLRFEGADVSVEVKIEAFRNPGPHCCYKGHTGSVEIDSVSVGYDGHSPGSPIYRAVVALLGSDSDERLTSYAEEHDGYRDWAEDDLPE